ncbi:hypothetical protein GCM10027091_41530 [Streptomyces daliensis]
MAAPRGVRQRAGRGARLPGVEVVVVQEEPQHRLARRLQQRRGGRGKHAGDKPRVPSRAPFGQRVLRHAAPPHGPPFQVLRQPVGVLVDPGGGKGRFRLGTAHRGVVAGSVVTMRLPPGKRVGSRPRGV